MSTTTTVSETTNKHQELLDKLPGYNVNSLWTVMHAMVTTKPSPKADVALWKYKELRPLLLEAGSAVTAEQAERRVLMLTNPALSAFPLPHIRSLVGLRGRRFSCQQQNNTVS